MLLAENGQKKCGHCPSGVFNDGYAALNRILAACVLLPQCHVGVSIGTKAVSRNL